MRRIAPRPAPCSQNPGPFAAHLPRYRTRHGADGDRRRRKTLTRGVCYSVQIYRSYIAQGQYDIVQDEIKDDAQTALQAVKLLATYKSKPDMKDIVLMTIKEWLSDSSTANNPVLQTVAGIIYLELGELEEAARVVHAGTTLEMVSLQVQIYLRMARVEVAQKSLTLMSRMEDDATLTQLTGAWINMALGGEKVQEAFYTFQVYFFYFPCFIFV